MTEAIVNTLLICATNVVVALLSRWWSHREHKETSKDVKAIKQLVNGQAPENDS